jgi:hypothetical protein
MQVGCVCHDGTVHGRLGRIAGLAAAIAVAVAGVTSVTRADPESHERANYVHREARSVPPASSRAPAQSTPSAPSAIAVQVSSNQIGAPMPPGFVGLSIEYRALRPYAGRDPRAIDPVFLALIRGIDPGQSPLLRIGGNSTDQTWWPLRRVVPPGGITFALTPNWLRVARAVAARLRAHLVLGINLAADDPAIAAAESRALLHGIGRRFIEALEIGNEADVYNAFAWYRDPKGKVYFSRPRSYSMDGFIRDFDRWRAAMPTIPLAGPAFAETNWMNDLSSLIEAEPVLRMTTFHRYPTRGCEGNPSAGYYASIPNLLSDSSSAGLAQQVAPYVTTSHAKALPFRLDELNSASCAGKFGVSNTFASALWVLDTLFNLQSVGVDGINIHTLPGSAYEPFTTHAHDRRWSAFVHPLYYGLLMFGQAFPPGARMLSLNAPSGPLKAWATQARDGRVRVVLINKDPVSAVTVRVQLPGPQTPVALEPLRAPALSATSQVTLGGQTFGSSTSTGVLPSDPHPATVSSVLGYYVVHVPPASAVMLTR